MNKPVLHRPDAEPITDPEPITDAEPSIIDPAPIIIDPEPEPDLAERLELVHARLDANCAEWCELTVELCSLYHQGRQLNPSNAAFSEWLHEHDLDHRLSADDRAAAIAMGGDLERTRAVLTTTDRRSLRLIYEQEWRLRSAAKTPPASSAGANANSTSTARPNGRAGATSGAGPMSGAGAKKSLRPNGQAGVPHTPAEPADDGEPEPPLPAFLLGHSPAAEPDEPEAGPAVEPKPGPAKKERKVELALGSLNLMLES